MKPTIKLLSAMVAALVLRQVLPAAVAAAAEKPNIVYILADDMGYADVGFNCSKDFLTPNIDKLAKEGTILTAMYGQPTCSPS